MQKTLGGDRLGSGKKNKVNLHGYERSTHDLGYIWRSTMASGTLVPFMSELALPGDTFDIGLDVDIKTHPTIGPLFGSYKIQLDVFQAPIRLYQAALHNNKLKIGLNMSQIKIPQMTTFIDPATFGTDQWLLNDDPDNFQVNSSCILSYLGIRGIGLIDPAETELVERQFNAVPYLAYWDIYKNYYANKQEEIGYVIHTAPVTPVETIDSVSIYRDGAAAPTALPEYGTGTEAILVLSPLQTVIIGYTGASPDLTQVIFYTTSGQFTAESIALSLNDDTVSTTISFQWNTYSTGQLTVTNWGYTVPGSQPVVAPIPVSFPLDDIDKMRETILANVLTPGVPFDVTGAATAGDIKPYQLLLEWQDGISPYTYTQEGLGLKTYQSDKFNNWLSTEWIDGVGGINDITAVDTSGGSFNIDTLNLAKKVYDMLNRIAVSGGTYDDWLDVTYDHERYTRCSTPIYHGGLSKELVFQEVVSNSSSTGGNEPLGTLAGKGVMGKSQKGGHVTIKVDEPSYILGIISLTPRIDYSQGNKWDTHLQTMDDLHKPAMDEIGFQELIQEEMAWWTTRKPLAGVFETKSAGKQPAWLNYMTNVNQTRGNFAIKTNEMFMTLNRRYDYSQSAVAEINDLTTYIDPSKFNFIFAQTSIDSQNFWAQIAIDITARRKMSAKVMPNL